MFFIRQIPILRHFPCFLLMCFCFITGQIHLNLKEIFVLLESNCLFSSSHSHFLCFIPINTRHFPLLYVPKLLRDLRLQAWATCKIQTSTTFSVNTQTSSRGVESSAGCFSWSDACSRTNSCTVSFFPVQLSDLTWISLELLCHCCTINETFLYNKEHCSCLMSFYSSEVTKNHVNNTIFFLF